MNKILLAVAVLVAVPAGAQAAPGTAAELVRAANDTVRAAVVADVCHNNSLLDSTVHRLRLSFFDRKAYDAVLRRLNADYRRSEGTDSALEAVKDGFCQVVVASR